MKLMTTFWSEEKHYFTQLFYVNNQTKEIMFQTNLNNMFETYLFFKNVAKFVQSLKARNVINNEKAYTYQFAASEEDKGKEVIFIKWFDLILNETTTLSHDIAFETTLIKKNNITLPFGKFPMSYKYGELSKYREFNLKTRAYKYVANQIKKQM